jgi:glycosyltransferase involved in cell wall biosynthesis
MSVTIGVYVYNGMPFIRDALQSIVDQTHKIDEIVISDNCSTDETVKTVYEFKEKYPAHKWIINMNQCNVGFLKNCQKVVELASSDYLLMLHADDVLKKNSIERLLDFFHLNQSLALVGGYDDIISENGDLVKTHQPVNDIVYNKGDIYSFLLNTNSYLPFSTVLHKTAILKEIGFNWDSLIADELYWPTALSKYPIAQLGRALTFRRIHEINTTLTYRFDLVKVVPEIRRHLKIADLQPGMKKKIKSFIRRKYAVNAMNNFIQLLKRFDIFKSFLFLLLSVYLKPALVFQSNPITRSLKNFLFANMKK